MCWVMPPASPAATSVSRIASSSEVLPWSTWPMIVTTGGPVDEVLVGVGELRLLGLLVGGGDDLELAVVLVGDRPDRLVGERLGERRHLAHHHQFFDHLGRGQAEQLGDLAHGRAGVDLGRLGLGRRRRLAGGSSSSGRRRRPPRRRGGRCGGGPPIWSRRAACESITTRRFFAPPPPPPAAACWARRRAHRFGRGRGGFGAPVWPRAAFSACGGRGRFRLPAGGAAFGRGVRLRRVASPGLRLSPRPRRCPWRRRSPSARRPPRRSRRRLSPRPRPPSAPPAAPCWLTPCAFAIS